MLVCFFIRDLEIENQERLDALRLGACVSVKS
jgi:hypothetical protein